MIKIGDRVKFLNDVGGGIVTGYMGKNMVFVENEDGFEVPYPVSKLINVDDPSLNRSEPGIAKTTVEKPPRPEVKEQEGGRIIDGKDSPDFYFGIVPDDSKNPAGGDVRFYLINDSNYLLLYRYAHYSAGSFNTIKTGEMQPNSRLELEVLGQDELNELPEFSFQIIYFIDNDKQLNQAIEKVFKISPVKFYKEKSFPENSFIPRNALMFQITQHVLVTEMDKLTHDDFKKVVEAKERTEPKVPVNKIVIPEIAEVDLHINELIDNPAGLSNKEILEIQKEKVENEMRWAIRNKVKRIVFIHGVGQGILKQEVARLLRSKFPKYAFQDASFKEYGFGATMVILRK